MEWISIRAARGRRMDRGEGSLLHLVNLPASAVSVADFDRIATPTPVVRSHRLVFGQFLKPEFDFNFFRDSVRGSRKYHRVSSQRGIAYTEMRPITNFSRISFATDNKDYVNVSSKLRYSRFRQICSHGLYL